MSNMSDYLEAKVLGVTLLGSPFTAPATVWVSLATSAATDGAVFNEVPTATGYARQVIAFGAPSDVGLSKQVTNTGLINFPTTTTPWGTVTHYGLYDSPTGGNQLYWGALTTARTIVTGDSPVIPISSLTVTAG